MIKHLLTAATLSGAMLTSAIAAQPLTMEVYNPGHNAVFPVSSEIISGKKDVVLIDAQFQKNDAQALVAKIQKTGKTLTTVYISHSDPDYYFGLDVIQQAFPKAKIVATKETVAAITASKDHKLAYWGPILKDNAPGKLIVPEVINGNSISLEGHTLEIKGPEAGRNFVWIPTLKAVVGGVTVSSNIYVWIADTQTAASRQRWFNTLDAITALAPTTVIPGHFLPNADGSSPTGINSVVFTREYLQHFEAEAAKANSSEALINAMKARYPSLGEPASLELSAKVIKGDMQWP